MKAAVEVDINMAKNEMKFHEIHDEILDSL